MKVENNLFDRLTETALAKFNLKKEEYPTMTKLLKEDLESTAFNTDLKYGSIISLRDFGFIEDIKIVQIQALFND